jgi:hypothetical protein
VPIVQQFMNVQDRMVESPLRSPPPARLQGRFMQHSPPFFDRLGLTTSIDLTYCAIGTTATALTTGFPAEP